MAQITKVTGLIRINWKTMAEFEILYKTLSMSVFTPFFWGIFHVIMKTTGYEYLTIENIVSFLTNPVTLIALLLLLGGITVYAMIDIGAVIFLLDQSYQKKKVNLTQTLRFAIGNAVKVFRGKNKCVIFVVLFLIPFLNIGVASGYVSSISVPDFIWDFIKKYWYLFALFTAAFVGLGVLLLRWLYAFHYFTLEKCDFKEARKRSVRLGKKRKIKDMAALLGIQFVFYFFYYLMAAAGVVLAVFLGNLFSRLKLLSVVSVSLVWVFLTVSHMVTTALATPISYACISILFYGHKEDAQEEIIYSHAGGFVEKRKKLAYTVEGVLLAASLVGAIFYLQDIYRNKVNIQVEYLRTMEVTAHRGASRFFPENTMSAFEGAKEVGADWIELDVQQSRDGQIFVMHDTNFKRTTGINRNTWEMDYGEIRMLDAGVFFGSAFAGEKIPLLSEVIEFAKENDIKLNIELKPTGHEQEFEKIVVDMIEAEDYLDHCVISSQVYRVLENVKAYNSDIDTVYVMSFAYGGISKLDAADHFSIEATSVTERIVSEVHNAGKEIYAWTVNSENNIEHMIDLNVDNIITDDVTLAKECIYLSKTSDGIAKYIKLLLEQ